MFIVYVNDKEILVTTPELEAQMIEEWFHINDRIIDEYDRATVADAAVVITSSMRLS